VQMSDAGLDLSRARWVLLPASVCWPW